MQLEVDHQQLPPLQNQAVGVDQIGSRMGDRGDRLVTVRAASNVDLALPVDCDAARGEPAVGAIAVQSGLGLVAPDVAAADFAAGCSPELNYSQRRGVQPGRVTVAPSPSEPGGRLSGGRRPDPRAGYCGSMSGPRAGYCGGGVVARSEPAAAAADTAAPTASTAAEPATTAEAATKSAAAPTPAAATAPA